jgi:hypothetical protein
MADAPNRSGHESVLTADLLAAYRGNVPNWEAVERESREKLAASLVVIYLLMLGNMDEDHELDIADAEAEFAAAGYATARAAEISGELTGGLRDAYDRLRSSVDIDDLPMGEPRSDLPPGRGGRRRVSSKDFEAEVEGIFTAGRASTIATTEITKAASEAEQRAAAIARANGKNLIAVWQTERDGKVCPICAPLDQQPVEVFENDFPGGPPGHPRCRCWLAWVPEEELVAR